MDPILSTTVFEECPLDRVFDKTMFKRRSGVIEDQRIGLPRRWTQASAYHLPVKPEAFGRPG
jgi:hypothetical protein